MIFYKTELDRSSRIPVLVKERDINFTNTCRSAREAAKMLNEIFHHGLQTEEVVYEICFDAACKPIAVFEISRGSVTTACCNPREIYQKALLVGAVSIIIAHNHPSGDVTPSEEDKEAADRLRKCGAMLDVKLLDFIVLSDEQFTSCGE